MILASAARAAEADFDLAEAEKALREARVGTDGPALLAFFKQRTLPAPDRVKLAALVRQLGADDFAAREKATRALLAAGRSALPLLRPAVNSEDPEIASRARLCVDKLEQGSDLGVVVSAARVLAARKPEGASGVLLAYLPVAGDEMVEEAVLEALAAVGLRGGKPAAALDAALKDREPVRRAAAASVLVRLADRRATVRRLLTDQDARVRSQAAAGLFRAGDKAAVPVLIALLVDAPTRQAQQAEDLLCRLIPDKAPPAALDVTSADNRRKSAMAWKEWWQANEASIDLAKIQKGNPLQGLTLASVTTGGGKDGGGRVWGFAKGGQVRWEIDRGLGGTAEVRLLPNRRVLIAEYRAHKVTERDVHGKIHWEKTVTSSPVSCQRLPNGNTFIATMNELLEVTRDGKAVYSHQRPGSIYHAVKMRTGHILYVHSGGNLVEFDPAAGKEVRTIAVGGTNGWGGIEVLRNGHYLVAQYSANQVVEIDQKGKVLWKVGIKTPALATRLPNGNILVPSSDGNRLVEVNRQGKEVWQMAVQGRPFCLRRY
jgi:HEAT repeat protein